ncbi:MAG: cytochrome c oxidase subunit II [Chloroflexota bacterium]|nr:cytochrome c oxidase subunit II [Chloroflexota bacterium]
MSLSLRSLCLGDGRPPHGVLLVVRRIAWPLAGGVTGLLIGGVPSIALAVPRPNWNPGPPWAPLTPHSSEMLQISHLFWVMLALSAIIFVGVTGAVLYSAFKFSAKPGDEGEPSQVYGDRRVEIAWTLVPFLILIVAFGFTVDYIHNINTPPSGSHPLNINAIGHQWWWEFDYPTLGVTTADEVHVPAGVPLHFHVQSYDVIHSFWVPELQRQIDANPGQDNAVFAEMSTPGTYDGMCYEYCGEAHAWMKFRLVVQTKRTFSDWIKHERTAAATPTTGLQKLGQRIFLHTTCVNCHAITGTSAGGAVGPNLTHLGSRWTVGAGAAPMTTSALEQWINDPNYFKPGVNMPPYPFMSQKQLRALAAYLISLK